MNDTTFDYDQAIDSLDQRIAVLGRYRRLLELQRQRLEDYLAIVDARDQAIAANDIDSLANYSEQEQAALRGVLTVQDCLVPLKGLYRELIPAGAPEINQLETRLERIRAEILRRNDHSRAILRHHADELKAELGQLRAKTHPASVYDGANQPSLIDIQG